MAYKKPDIGMLEAIAEVACHLGFPMVGDCKAPKHFDTCRIRTIKGGTSMSNQTSNCASDPLPRAFPRKSTAHSKFRIRTVTIVTCLLAMGLAAGCASTKITNREELVTAQLPRPATIWVYDFAASAADVPAESALAGQVSEDAMFRTPENLATGRKLGAQIAAQLVEEIRGMGLSAMDAGNGAAPPIQINDIVIRGYLISYNEGSAAKRLIVGFGSGASDLKVAAEGFQMTAQGLRKLGSGTLDAGGSKTPGTALGVATLLATHNPAGLIISGGMKVYGEESGRSTVEGRAKQTAKEIGDVLKKRFEQEGWIQ